MSTESTRPLAGKTVVVTGATSGLGREAALALAAMGATLYLIGRDPERTERTVTDIAQHTGNDDLRPFVADLSSQSAIHGLAGDLLASGDRIDMLLNNAGAVFGLRREVSRDGIEMTMALNHFGYFTLTLLLVPRLRDCEHARIVNVASDAYKDAKGHFDFDDYNAEHGYKPIRQYGRSKLANILFTRELARRLPPSVTANACSPPRLTATRFAHNVHFLAKVSLLAASPFTLSPRKGAQSLVHLASSPEVGDLTGTFWSGLSQPELTDAATDDGDARRLWELSEEVTGVHL